MMKKKFFSKQVKKTLPYQLLVLSLIVLVILILIWVILFVLGKVDYFPKDDGLKGELGTLKWDFREGVILDVLNYTISENNQTIEININWSSGEEDLRAILINFTGPIECNYTTTVLPSFGVNQTYLIDFSETSCNLNFENTTNVFAYAQINIPLTQISPIEDITLYNDDDGIEVVDLDAYFNCLENINFGFIESPENDYLEIKINDSTNLITLIQAVGWYGTQRFNLTASCDGDVLDVNTNGNNMSFDVIVLNSSRIIPNNAPEFLEYKCENLGWEINVNYLIDLDDCFDDEDDDDLDFRYENVSGHNDYLTISLDDDELILTPDNNWVGSGYFYVYADDSTYETRAKIYFSVVNTSTTNTTSATNSDSSVLKILSSSPSNSNVNVFTNKTQKFQITADNYESIKWYLDGKLIKEGGLSYNFKEVEEGDYTIKVEIFDGTTTDSKTWNIVVEESIKEDEEDFVEFGVVIFYLIVFFILIIISLILWLFIAEKNSKKKKINYMGFGISGIKKK